MVNAKTSIAISVRMYTASVVCLQRKQVNINLEKAFFDVEKRSPIHSLCTVWVPEMDPTG